MFRKIKEVDKILFARHLALMLKAGLSVSQGIEALAEQASSKRLKKILERLLADINKGEAISTSLSRDQALFGNLFINMIKVGEESGTLEENLNHLALELEKKHELKRKVKSAMIYPLLILAATLSLAMGLGIFVLPKLLGFFKSLSLELPVSTKILLFVIENLENYGLYYIGGFILFIILLRLLLRVEKIKIFVHELMTEMPLLGRIVKKLNLAYFSRTLGILLKSGVPIVRALEISASTLGNLAYRKRLEQAAIQVKKGENLASFLKGCRRLVPSMTAKMIDVGEKTGSLEETLFYLADFYEGEVDAVTKNLANILEPVLLIGIGLMVGGVAISILMPIYQFTSSLQP